MRWSRAVTHQLAITVLGLSLVLASAIAVWAPWSGRSVWVAAWGALAYAAVVVLLRQGSNAAPVPSAPPVDRADADADLARLTEEALRALKNPSALGASRLASQIPHLLAEAAGTASGAGRPRTPLAQAQSLREVLEASIARLQPVEGARADSDHDRIVYAILHEEYVLGRPNTQIMTRHSISESTFHRYRRAGVRAVAGDLARLEGLAREAS